MIDLFHGIVDKSEIHQYFPTKAEVWYEYNFLKYVLYVFMDCFIRFSQHDPVFSFQVELIEEELAVKQVDLISGIGGTVGLFLGASFMSFSSSASLLYLKIKSYIEKK